MRILIVSYNWPPRNAIGTLRPYSWAESWAKKGAEVTVITSEKREFDEPLDLQFACLENVNVIEIPFGGQSNFVSRLLKQPRIRKAAKRIKRLIGRHSTLAVDVRQAWAAPAGIRAAELASNFDAVVSTFGPASSHYVACEAKKSNPDLKWFADYRDLWSDNPHPDITDDQRSALRKKENATVAEWADVITTVSQTFANKLQAQLGKTPTVISNGYDISLSDLERNIEIPPPLPKKRTTRIVYTGTIYKGSQTPEPLLKVLMELHRDGKISADEVCVEFYGSRVEVAESFARNRNYAPFIKLMGHVPREKALQAQQTSDLLLLLENPAAKDNGVLTGKVYEYLAAGRPVLSLGSAANSEIAELLNSTRTGICCGMDEGKIHEVIETFLKVGSSPGWYDPQILEIKKYSRDNQASIYFDLILDSVN